MSAAFTVIACLGLVGFGLLAAMSRCKREQGDTEGTKSAAYEAIACLLIAIVFGLVAWRLK